MTGQEMLGSTVLGRGRLALLLLSLAISVAGEDPAGAPNQEPWIEILSPKAAELFLERDHPPTVSLHFRVHGVAMGEGRGEARVFLIRNAISYGGDAFRGREGLREAPHATIHAAEASLDLGELDLGLHQDGVCHGAAGCSSDGSSSAAAAELLSAAFDEKAWSEEEDDDDARAGAALLGEYAALHARMALPGTPREERRLLILDQRAGGLGNRLGSILSGLLLAILSNRALVVYWDLRSYLLDGDEEQGGILWQHPSLESIQERYGVEATQGPHFSDMGEMADMLVCANLTEALASSAAVHITNPHYYLPLLASNPHHRRDLLQTLGAKPAGALFNFLFKLAPYLQAKVDGVKQRFQGHVIGLQVRMARDCGKITLEADLGGRTRTHAYLTEEHERLFYACGTSLLRAARGNASFFVASDIPSLTRPEAVRRLGEHRVIFAELPDMDVHGSRAAMEEGRPTDFDGAFLDLWLLGECDEVITTPASSFGYMATARTARPPLTVSKWGKCLRPLSSEPFSHAWLLVKDTSCFDPRMLLPEFDMFCQDCVVLECACGDLTCASHSERMPPLFPRQVATVPG